MSCRRYGAFAGPGYSRPGARGHDFGGRYFRILSGLKRDPFRGKISGVCAGIAGYYGIRLWVVRAVAIVALAMNPMLTIAAYLAATFFLRPISNEDGDARPAAEGGNRAKARAPESDLSPELRFAALKDKFREVEGRTGAIETLVTSPEFRLRRDFRKMGEG
jgi:phage shock protein C